MKVAIIGGSGKMGRWFAGFLLREGKEVIITGRNVEKLLGVKEQLGVEIASNAEAAKSADVILLSVSIESLEEVVRQISPHIQARQIVMDITSIKTLPVDLMHRHIKKGRVLGVHPLFGPGAEGLAGRNFVLTPTSADEEVLAGKVREYLEARGANVAFMTPREHDEMMSIVLGLSHFIGIVSADTLISSGKLERMGAIGGTTYKLLLTLAKSVVSEDAEFYASLQMNLPGVAEVEKLFQAKARGWADLVKTGNKREFVRRMKALKEGFSGSPDLAKAYQDMYKIVEGL